MKKFKKIINFRLLLIILILITGCESTNLDVQESNNGISKEKVNPDLLFNSIQLSFIKALNYNEDGEDGINVRTAELSRMQQMQGTYLGPSSLQDDILNSVWAEAYSICFADTKLLKELGQENPNLTGHIAISQILESYLWITWVDIWGEIPFSEALNGNTILQPKVDDGASIYAEIFTRLDKIIITLKEIQKKETQFLPNDLFYNGNLEAWLACAYTLKLKMLLQIRWVDTSVKEKIETLRKNNLINSEFFDFQFQYSTIATPNDSRNPYFTLNYDQNGADDYLNTYYVNLLFSDKNTLNTSGEILETLIDPRIHYYFYRPFDNVEDDNGGYYTRSHANNDPIPNDSFERSTYGLYPYGGAFDDSQYIQTSLNSGAKGAGIFPILLSFYVDFMLAEIELVLNTDQVKAREFLEKGIRGSFNKVLNFRPEVTNTIPEDLQPTENHIDTYVEKVIERYNNSLTSEEKLNTIIKEYYIALWGNGIEAYNTIRRTGMPKGLETPVIEAGAFPRRFPYPSNVINRNRNIKQQNISKRIFWDKDITPLK